MITLVIILSILLAAAVAAAVYFAVTRGRKARRAVEDYGDDLRRQIHFASDDALRYKKLYETLKNDGAKAQSS
ncbi:MAG: hypothetical protein J5826_06660, partial [Bacteroidales bacterium]|nr:hypothetical protein [Bacteroidales bacterium]